MSEPNNQPAPGEVSQPTNPTDTNPAPNPEPGEVPPANDNPEPPKQPENNGSKSDKGKEGGDGNGGELTPAQQVQQYEARIAELEAEAKKNKADYEAALAKIAEDTENKKRAETLAARVAELEAKNKKDADAYARKLEKAKVDGLTSLGLKAPVPTKKASDKMTMAALHKMEPSKQAKWIEEHPHEYREILRNTKF